MAYRVPLEHPTEGIEFNLKGRQPLGIVPVDEYESLAGQIAGDLGAAIDPRSGKTVFAEIHRRDEVYSGPALEHQAPDLVCVFADGYGGAWGSEPPVFASVPLSELSRHRGGHSTDGMLVLSGPSIRKGVSLDKPSVLDVAPTLLHALGLPVPSNLDGRVLQEAFLPDELRPVRFVEPLLATGPAGSQLSRADAGEITERLRGLGYLG
jgi:predicted AlkP superfamily phosphohydrolase/phosphomutase